MARHSMKSRSDQQAFTLLEVLMIIIAAAVLIVLLFPARTSSRKAPRVVCTANLKGLALAFNLWAADQGGTNFPWRVETNGGTFKYSQSPEVLRHFKTISNYLNRPEILVCPSDTSRKPARSWESLPNRNFSYFLNLSELQSLGD